MRPSNMCPYHTVSIHIQQIRFSITAGFSRCPSIHHITWRLSPTSLNSKSHLKCTITYQHMGILQHCHRSLPLDCEIRSYQAH